MAGKIDETLPFQSFDITVLATGGTGFSPRDMTPEAVKPPFRQERKGFSVGVHMAKCFRPCSLISQVPRFRSICP